jgi:HlyD family secretion protein
LIEIKLKFKKSRWPVFISIVALSGYWLMQEWLGSKVEGYSVVKEELVQSVVAGGKVEFPSGIEISSRVNGKVAGVMVAQGAAVSAGQILLTLENKEDRGALEKARAATAQAEARFRKISEQTQAGSEQSLNSAKSALDKAKTQYARVSELAARGYVSQAQTSDALRNLTIAQSQLATLQFQAKTTRAKGSDYALPEIVLNKARAYERAARDKSASRVIKAASAGVLTSCKVARGEVVLPGKTLLVITPVGKTRLLVQLEEKNMRDLKLGQTATVVAADAYPDQRFNAALNYINPEADTARSTVDLKFDAINPPDYLSQGMSVSLEIEVSRRADALPVPATAIRNAEGFEPWVMFVDGGRAQRRTVRPGVRAKDKIEILEGLHEGDFVLLATGAEVEEGKRLRLARAG